MNTEIFSPQEAMHHHHFDQLLEVMNEILNSFDAEPSNIVHYDLGCGDAWYIKNLAIRNPQASFVGVEGSLIEETLNGVLLDSVQVIQWDLRNPLYIGKNRGFVSCIEVMEHVHADFHDVVMNTLSRHCAGTLLISWAVRGQTGTRHVAERNENEVIPYVERWGFRLNRAKTDEYRQRVGSYLAKSLYLFERENR